MTEASKSITMDQYDRFTLPLGKALSILELALEGMSPDAANGVIAAQEIISEAKQIVRGWVENDIAEKPDPPVKLDLKDLCITLNEALSMADHSIDLVQCVRADLAGKPRPPLGQEPEKILP